MNQMISLVSFIIFIVVMVLFAFTSDTTKLSEQMQPDMIRKYVAEPVQPPSLTYNRTPDNVHVDAREKNSGIR
jgi:hypothetical protein